MRSFYMVILLFLYPVTVFSSDNFASSDYECSQLQDNDHLACAVHRQQGPTTLLMWMPPAPSTWTKADNDRRAYRAQIILDAFIARGGHDIRVRTRDIHGTLASRTCGPNKSRGAAVCAPWHKADESNLPPWWANLMSHS